MQVHQSEREELYNNKKKECSIDIHGNTQQWSAQKFMKDRLYDLAKNSGLMKN